jgi:hypothetical protein
MGKYHGESGFRACTNVRGVLHHSDPAQSRHALSACDEYERLRGLISRLS